MTLYYNYIQTTMKNDEKNSDKNKKCNKIRIKIHQKLIWMLQYMQKEGNYVDYCFKEMYIHRKDNGKALYLTKFESESSIPERNLLMIHGLTYAQFVFDIKYKDYSLCEYFAGQGYTVWRLDIGGYGKSESYEKGWDVTTENAAKDQLCAIKVICEQQSVEKIDLLGWSWGSMTTAKAAIWQPDQIRKLVWLGPCFGGVFEPVMIHTPFLSIDDDYVNRIWRKDPECQEQYDQAIVEPMLLNLWSVLAYRQKGERLRPAGGAKEIMEAGDKWLIEPEKIKVPVLIVTGDSDFYVNVERCYEAVGKLPQGSAICHLKHAGHAMYLEKNFYQKTRQAILNFLEEE